MKLMEIYGLRRSGNHGIINWIMANHYGRGCFLNDVGFPRDNPQRICKSLPAFKNFEYIKSVNLNHKPNIVIASYENRNLEEVLNYEVYQNHCEANYKYVDSYQIVILRDFYNLAASCYQSLKDNKEFLKTRSSDVIDDTEAFANIWVQYAEAFLENPRVIGIDYDGWVSSKKYRDSISDTLEFKNFENGLNSVASYGYGSSFEKGNKKKASSLYISRWKRFKEDEEFIELMRKCQIIKPLYRKIYGESEQYRHFTF